MRKKTTTARSQNTSVLYK